VIIDRTRARWVLLMVLVVLLKLVTSRTAQAAADDDDCSSGKNESLIDLQEDTVVVFQPTFQLLQELEGIDGLVGKFVSKARTEAGIVHYAIGVANTTTSSSNEEIMLLHPRGVLQCQFALVSRKQRRKRICESFKRIASITVRSDRSVRTT